MHIHFLIPCFGGQISEATFTSFVRFIAKAPEWGLEWSLDTLVNESLIPRGRNALVARAMHNPRATHMMFLDADIGFEPEFILMLLQEDVDVIGGGYPKKSLPIDYVINPLADGESDDNKAEVERIGTGFLMFKRDVFSRMADAMPELKYLDDCGLDPSINQHLYAYFECGLFGEKVFMSEDWLFCNRWRKLGGQIFISKRFALSHVGNYEFSEASQGELLHHLSTQLQSPTSANVGNPTTAPLTSSTGSEPPVKDPSHETKNLQPKRKSSDTTTGNRSEKPKRTNRSSSPAKPTAKTSRASKRSSKGNSTKN
jgi:hypothetical protein